MGDAYNVTSKSMIPLNLGFFEGGGGSDKDSKTEQPTSQKLDKARKEGQVVKSQEVSTAFTLLVLFFSLRLFGGWMYGNIVSLINFDWEMIPHSYDMLDTIYMSQYISFLFQQVILIAAPLMAVAVLSGVVSNLIQVGWTPTVKPMMPKLSKLNPLSGFKRMFSMQSVVNLLKSLAKLAVVSLVVVSIIRERMGFIPAFLEMDMIRSTIFIADMIIDMGIAVGVVFILVALADYAYTRYSHIKKLKMTKQEVKDEYKQQEGDPMVKNKIRQKMREVSMRRMMQNVPEADVVITNPTHYAVALRYNNMVDTAPVVLAKGMDFMAKRIREKAKENNVTIVENPSLARAIYADVDVGDEIPPELWEAVVEILAYVFKLKNRVG